LLWLHTGRVADADAVSHFAMRDLFVGGFIGLIELTDVVAFDSERWSRWRDYHLAPGPSAHGLFAWMIADPHRFARPVPAPGQQGLFEIAPETRIRNLTSLQSGASGI
jgi:hypothetical protein